MQITTLMAAGEKIKVQGKKLNKGERKKRSRTSLVSLLNLKKNPQEKKISSEMRGLDDRSRIIRNLSGGM